MDRLIENSISIRPLDVFNFPTQLEREQGSRFQIGL